MPKHTLRSLTLGSHFLDTIALAKHSSESYVWVMIVAFFLEVKKHSQYFRTRFQSRSLNPQ